MIDLECDSPLAFGSNPDPDIRIGVQYEGGFRVRNYESFRSRWWMIVNALWETKMEMAGEMEKMRMKMEMKQNQMIMESQK
ncbi:hypothetical protein ACFX13_008475 [Malus domestica]